ncbi:MAG: hypothetical protein SH847_11355 [Roseiflexaceae bacterium]|nr:hypothetical protein [Roseiflexaceae bacterium]
MQWQSAFLDMAAEFGLNSVLITCDTDNIGSVRVIEKNGGKLQDHCMIEGHNALISRYWIDL